MNLQSGSNLHDVVLLWRRIRDESSTYWTSLSKITLMLMCIRINKIRKPKNKNNVHGRVQIYSKKEEVLGGINKMKLCKNMHKVNS
ncbi:unnamed protein product [Prunus brigantina]